MPKYTSPSDLGGNCAPLPNETAPSPRNNAVLDQLLRRGDVWRGHSAAFNHKSTLATGHSALDPLLLGNGWPLNPTIVEAYQQWDLSGSFDINDNVSIFVEGINLTEEYVHKRGRYANQLLLIEDSGRRLALGVRASF